MRSGGNNFNYFPENKLTKMANFVQFIRMLMFCPNDWGGWTPPWLLEETEGCVDLGRLLYTKMVYLSAYSHPSR